MNKLWTPELTRHVIDPYTNIIPLKYSSSVQAGKKEPESPLDQHQESASVHQQRDHHTCGGENKQI